MILVIDNYDSFTYNLVQILLNQKWSVKVIKNDEWDIERIKQESKVIKAFLISPGPGHPSQAILSHQVVAHFFKTHPILGVCLGHQVVAEHFGARIQHAQSICHGKLSVISHSGVGCFSGLKTPLSMVRYHSLIAAREGFPEELEVTAWVENSTREIMGLRHKHYPVEGVQFHPESILSEHGEQLVTGFFRKNCL